MSTTFIGVDLAWQSDRNTSGGVVLRGSRSGAKLDTVSAPLASTDAVLAFVRAHAGDGTVTAIDAPLIIPNETGMRPCERLVGVRYGAREASCHTANKKLYPNAGSVRLAEALVADGHVHAPAITSRPRAPVIAEVYPHAAMVALFDLQKTIKYKQKWGVVQQRTGLEIVRSYLSDLACAEPPLLHNEQLSRLLATDLMGLRGRALKEYEDTLDALVCAYIAYFFWRWLWDKNEVFGDVDGGYILNPVLVEGGIAPNVPVSSRPWQSLRPTALDIVRATMGRPLREEVGSDGALQLVAGDPGEVVAQVTDTNISILEFAIKWQGPHSPVHKHVPVADVHLPLAATDLKKLLGQLIALTRRRRRRRFRTCKFCNEHNPPEWMHARDTCQGCAQQRLGVVY